jgi:hypothetical protein
VNPDWVELLGPVVIVGSAVVGTITSAIVAHRRRGRHVSLHDAQEALERVGFKLVRVKEIGDARDEWEAPAHTTVSLRGSLDDRTSMTLGFAREHATGALRVAGLAVVKRVTFTIGREDAASRLARKAGISDIEVGDAKLDDALKLRGWPVDTVRGVIAVPAVRAALAALFAHEAVVHVRLGSTSDGFGKSASLGALTVSWRLPWARVQELRAIADRVHVLAAALDEARWAEARGAPTDEVIGAAGPSSGSPFGVPGGGGG